MIRKSLFAALILAVALPASGAWAQAQQLPAAIAVSGATTVATFHGVGAQIYECKADPKGKLTWTFREPIAALVQDGKTVGRHYAGPTWEDNDGSKIVGKASGNAPGATANDVPWLKLDVVDKSGNGVLSNVTTVQRINTKGGAAKGACKTAGELRSVPYSADYVFLGKGS